MGLEDLLGEVLRGVLEKQPPALPEMPEMSRPQGAGQEPTGIGRIMRGVVQVVALRQGFLGGMSSAWTGSGTIVDPSGLILTNCHVANPRAMGMSSPPADRLGIAMTERSDQPPAVSYFAKVVAQAPELDLAVLQIVADVKGNRIRNLALPHVEIGDSDALELGDRLSIFGYPGIGGDTVTYTAGNVAGFSSDRNVRDSRAWIKTDATIAGGNSGGTAVNDQEELVGVPTQAAAGSGVTPVDARPVLDTNRDGRVDSRDTPMAVGGFINGLRPVKLALPLLAKAGLDVDLKSRSRRRAVPMPSEQPYSRRNPDRAEFSNLLFSTTVTEDGRPINPTTHIPQGHDTVYATFEHADVPAGTPWSVVWMANGQVIIDQKDTWDDDRDGRKVVKISNRRGLPIGEYHLVLGIRGGVELEGKVMVGTPVDDTDSQVSGRLVDARSQQGIDNGIVVVLKPGANLRNFLRNQEQQFVFTSTRTQSDGRFKFPEQLPKGQAYSLVAASPGYRPVAVEGALRVSSGAPEHADIGDIELTRS